ncbi:Separin [Phytophthora palmivora]|uniref:Separin n=1 Tax=Phytophthora palmivora TaxID=4796 RepID=A0A2P4XM35_9STRA|nr:Separin [Phytophthora palmivora]
MARTRGESAAHVLSWLRRGYHQELSVERVLEAIRSVHGVVPLGGRVGGADGTTPPATPKNSALTLFSAEKNTKTSEKSTEAEDDDKRWTLLLTSVQLPSSGSQQELRKALETLWDQEQQDKDKKRLNIDSLRRKFFSERRNFFAVRIELLRAARNQQHPNAQAAEEVVDELLKEGLREALLDEMHGRQFYQPPRFAGVGTAERLALVAWELQFLEEEALLRELLLLVLVASREKATLDCAVKIAKTVHSWEVRVFDEIFTTSTLAMPVAQEMARKLTQVGMLVALRLLHTTGAVQEHGALQQVTKNFFLSQLYGGPDAMSEEPVASPVTGKPRK